MIFNCLNCDFMIIFMFRVFLVLCRKINENNLIINVCYLIIVGIYYVIMGVEVILFRIY